MRKWALVAALVVLIAAPASAFDGYRKGFVLGGGLGIAPNASWSWDYEGGEDDNGAGVGLNLLIGYSWDEHNMIVYEGNVVAYSTLEDLTASQGFNGISWYHYFGPAGRSFFTAVGIGAYVFQLTEDKGDRESASTDPGPGVLIGGGYEFARHVQVGAYLSFGRTSEFGIDWEHTHASILVSAVAF